jgi:hypothetical protein
MYMAALEKAPADAELLLSLGLARMMSTPPQLQPALRDVEEVIQRHPNNAQAYVSKADICERMSNFDEAEAALQMAVRMSVGMDRVRAQQLLANVRVKRAQTQAIRMSPQSDASSVAQSPLVSRPTSALSPPATTVTTSTSPIVSSPMTLPFPKPSNATATLTPTPIHSTGQSLANLSTTIASASIASSSSYPSRKTWPGPILWRSNVIF